MSVAVTEEKTREMRQDQLADECARHGRAVGQGREKVKEIRGEENIERAKPCLKVQGAAARGSRYDLYFDQARKPIRRSTSRASS